MHLTSKLALLALTLWLLPLGLLGCATSSPPSVVAPPLIPPLPTVARTSAVAVGCSPKCSEKLGMQQAQQAQRLTAFESQGQPASVPITH